ncbi:heme ABC exporter, ATP-binding protein CcmA [Neorickettsia helminthoeca str. Oregon]|uniref:Heme ABC exporter, ATP-binding protein CcmA n=1 Tax=Neorickettsia helminthoeca str. Oregon TaxID=1286528 RepID=X5H4V5_9RICK|nr:heme ABC exporter ATP-binding protein CcmA [Neorickettsia helminthoeca]AHX11596.1 heme ABC exporter, ATP-binding protein CcmA [Neorickettsia helminthoeca str. Oregon]
MFRIEANNISFAREDVEIFSNISFTVNSGEILWIKGDNGSGKTTLLRIIAGIIRNFSGEILFQGKPITQNTLYNSEITYIGEKSACDEEYSIFENLLFWAKLRDRIALLEATLEFFNLGRIAHVEVKKLSSGWKKRVALAKLLLFNSKIWILDEPFTYLDTESIKLFVELFESRLEQRGIIVLVNHGELDITNLTVKELRLSQI